MRSTLHRRPHTGGGRATALALLALALTALTGTAMASGREWVWLPEGRLHEPYIADPLEHTFSIQWISVTDEEIEGTGSPRFGMQLGGSFAVIRRQPAGDPARGWQLSIEAGAAIFSDIENSWDVIGWDGIAGLIWSGAFDHGLSARAGIMHRSGHLGDEYLLETFRRRIDYTREEYVAGLSWRFRDSWRVYGEAGWAFTNQAEGLQEPWRVQGGLEFQSARHLLGGRGGWYAATNIASTEERDWQADVSGETGLYWYTGPRRWRAGIRYYSGRVPLGEFFLADEQYLMIGIWHDI